MSNLFLPPFPEVGLSLDYVETINAIFTAIANHTHVENFGNTIESDSITWDQFSLFGELNDCKSIVFNNTSTTVVNSLYAFQGDLYFYKTGGIAIKITNRPFVNAGTILNGISGDFQEFGINLFYSDPPKSFTFSSDQGLLNLLVFDCDVTQLITTSVNTNTFECLKAPNVPPDNGYAYFNANGTFLYSPLSVIKLDNTTVSPFLIYDNLVTFDFQPFPRAQVYPSIPNGLFSSNRVDYFNGGNGVFSSPTYYDLVWFPIVSNGNSQMFFGQYLKLTLPTDGPDQAFAKPASGNAVPAAWSQRTIFNVGAPYTLNHYQIDVSQISYSYGGNMTQYLRRWNDCAISNTYTIPGQGPGRENFVIFDFYMDGFMSNQNIELNFQYSWLYDIEGRA